MSGFVNLHSHTCYSQLDAIIRPKDLFARAKELGYKAVAVTDHGVMSGILEAYEASKATGVKFIPGNEIYFTEDLNDPGAKRRHLVLLAGNHTGFKNLLKITSEGFKNATTVMGKEVPKVDEAILRKYSEGIFATSACGGSAIANAIFNNDFDKAKQFAKKFADIFKGKFYIELQPHKLSRKDKKTGITFDQMHLNNCLKSIAEELGLPMVATCDSHYLTPKHEIYHDMVLAISAKKPLDDLTRHRYSTCIPCKSCDGSGEIKAKFGIELGMETDVLAPCTDCAGTGVGQMIPCQEFYLKSEQEMLSFFEAEYDSDFAKQLIANTEFIASQCEPPTYMEASKDHLPRFNWHHINQCDDAGEFKEWLDSKPALKLVPEENAYIRFRCWVGFSKHTSSFTKEDKKIYWDRIVKEIDILEARSFCSYMLIVADFINWAIKNGIDIGPGRGSAGGSLVAFLMNMHEVDPIKYGLYFERFQSRERAQLPDFDCDISSVGRQSVADYVINKYGPDYVAYVSNVNRFTPKVLVSDIVRSLNIGGDKSAAFKIAKEITADIPDDITLPNGSKKKVSNMSMAMDHSKKLRTFLDQYPVVLDYANEITGLPRAMSTHAGGLIISDVPLADIAPLRTDKDGRVAVAYDKDYCERAKLVKMDLLGLGTLDVLRNCYNMAKSIGLQVPPPREIPEGDEKAFKMIHAGHACGIFQLEGDTIAPLCPKFKPSSITDIATLSALGRPGCSKEERDDFIERRFKRAPVTYPHPLLRDILAHTNGIKIFDEDLLRIAQDVAGWNLSEADGLRKLTKLKEKGSDLAVKLEAKFIEDCQKHSGISKKEAVLIWEEVVLPFSKYGFCKAHAVAYAIVGYRTAYYKAHARAPFLCALLNSVTYKASADQEEQIQTVKREIRKFKIALSACDINNSKDTYNTKDSSTIVTGLVAIDGLGPKALEEILANQPYSSFEDFLDRTSVNKTAIQALAKAGAFDTLQISRKYAHDNFEAIKKAMAKEKKACEKKGVPFDPSTLGSPNPQDRHVEWSMIEKLNYEKEVLGECVSGGIEDLYPGFFKGGMNAAPFSKVKQQRENSTVKLEGLISIAKEILIKKPGKNMGKKMGKLTLENALGETIEVTVWPDMYEKIGNKIEGPTPIIANFTISSYNGDVSLVLGTIERLGVK